MSKHDVIVVGAGSGGLIAARGAACAGLRVLLLDRSRRARLGRDWCDVVEEGIFPFVGLPTPTKELHRPTMMPAFASPSLATVLRAREPSRPLPFLYLDRKRWLDALVEEVARHPNVELRDDVEVTAALLSGTRVRGVVTAGEVVEAPWTIDASGANAVIASRVPHEHPHAPDPILDRDVFVAMKELVPSRHPEHSDVMMPGYRGGFGWIMTFWEGVADVGLALPRDRAPARLRAEVDRLKHRLGIPHARPLRRGGGVLPARRPRTRLVGDGWVVVGDAACQVNPSNGAGIASSMRAGHLAAEAIAAARDVSARSVWRYASMYLRTEGAAFAAMDALRVHFLRIGEDDLEHGFARGIVTHGDLSRAFLDASIPPIVPRGALRRGLRCATRPRLLVRLLAAIYAAHGIERLYASVPADYDAAAIAAWERRILAETARW